MDSRIRVGSLFAGYRVDAILGRGGMSVVYLAEHVRLGRKVSLKILAPELSADPRFRERFVRESRIAAGLDHPNIIPIYEADEVEGQLFIAMRYVKGTDLAALIGSEGPLDLERTTGIVKQVGAALDAAHENGLVHRDVKPANILVTPTARAGRSDHVYLSDFGITKHVAGVYEPTTTGQIMGSVDYIAPEQIEGRPLDGRADVYSLGCVLFECLTARVPFPRDSDIAVLWAHVRDKPPAPTEIRPGLPKELDGVVAKAMAKSPTHRFATCGDLTAAVEDELTTSLGMRTPHTGKPTAGRAWFPAAVSAAAVAVIAAISVLVVATRGGPTGPSGSTAPPTPPPIVSGRSLMRIDSTDDEFVAFPAVVPQGPKGLATGEGVVWVITPAGLFALERGSQTPYNVTTLHFLPRDIAVAGSWIWAIGRTPSGQGKIAMIDAVTRRVIKGLPIRWPPDHVAANGRVVWILSGRAGKLLLLHIPPGNRVPEPLDVGGNATGLAIGPNGGAWVINSRERTVQLVSAKHRHRIARDWPLPNARSLDDVAVDKSGAWVLDEQDSSVISIDPRYPKRNPEVIRVGHDLREITTGDGYVWVLASSPTSVYRISESVPYHIMPIGLSSKAVAISSDHGGVGSRPDQVWVLLTAQGS